MSQESIKWERSYSKQMDRREKDTLPLQMIHKNSYVWDKEKELYFFQGNLPWQQQTFYKFL